MRHSSSLFLRLLIAVVTVTMVAGCMDASLSQSGVGPARISILQAPAGVTEVSLTISGPGMTTISKTITPATDAVVLEIPIGPDRVFEASAGGYSARVVRAVTAGGVTIELTLWIAAEGTLLFARGTFDANDNLTNADLYTIGADGANEQRLTNLSIPITGFGWTPNGEWIVLISTVDDTNGELYRLRADGTEFTRLTNNTATETIGGIEPNGTRLAYAYDTGNGPSVFTIDIAAPTPVETEIATARGFTFSQSSIETAAGELNYVSADVVEAWSPDGASLLYASNETSVAGGGLNGRLYFTPDGGQTETPISTQAEAAVSAQWLSDGSGVIYAQTDTGDPADMDIYRYDVAGQSSTQLTDNTLLDRSLELSPDGTTILFERFDPLAQFGGSEYRLVDVFSGSETALTSPADFIPIYARWITGTNEIAAFGFDAGTFAVQLRIISSTGTELQIIENSQLAEGYPAQWSPDGRTASVMVDQSGDGSGEFDLFLFSRDSGGFSKITETPEAEIGGYWRP